MMLSSVTVGIKASLKSPKFNSNINILRAGICHLHPRASIFSSRNHRLPCALALQNNYRGGNTKQSGRGLSFSSAKDDSVKQSRPFKVLGLQQIAIGSLQKSELTDLWGNLLGLKRVGTYKREIENVDEDIYVIGKEESPFAVEVDLMTPLDAEKRPKVHKPALNHIGLWVDDLPAAVDWLTTDAKVRFAPGGIRKGASGYDVAFIHPVGNDTHPKAGCGVLIELVQAPENIVRALDQ